MAPKPQDKPTTPQTTEARKAAEKERENALPASLTRRRDMGSYFAAEEEEE